MTPAALPRFPLVAALLVAGLAVSGCGRRGPLEAPPDASAPSDAAALARPGAVQRATPRREVVASPTTLATQSGSLVANDPGEDDDEPSAISVTPQPTPSRRGRTYLVPKEPFVLDPLL